MVEELSLLEKSKNPNLKNREILQTNAFSARSS